MFAPLRRPFSPALFLLPIVLPLVLGVVFDFSAYAQQDSLTLETPDYSHTITLHDELGLPGSVILTVNGDEKPAIARMLIELDGNLVTLQLKYLSALDAFREIFPTPAHSLTYRFQFIYENGKIYTSSSYFTTPECGMDRAVEETLLQATAFLEQKALLQQAIEFDRTSTRLEHIAQTLTSLKKRVPPQKTTDK